jgi:WD40 repeat protein/DNA-binding SARP family transcriptional activator
MLALRANHAVSADELMEGLWGEHPPATASKMVQQYVSQLRRLLADDNGEAAEILTRGRGYELRIPPERVDTGRFERLLSEGAAREALALWRGPALADVSDEPFAAAAIRRLDELRLAAVERAIDMDLADGRHRELVGELEALVAEHPLSERLPGQLMLALYRSGRQAEALEVYRRARSALVEEIGVEPGPELRRLHEAILRQDVALAAPGAGELPQELETSSPLLGRDAELERLRSVWERARAGGGALVVVSGPQGSGRTRLVAELAGEVDRQGALVLYGATATARARAARRRTLLVLDDVRASACNELAEAASGAGAGPLLVVATTDEPALAARLPAAEHLALRPLPAHAVAAIAALYAPEGAEIPVAELAARSKGLPVLAHRLAAEWARAETARRLDDVAARTAGERGDLRRAEEELAGTVVELQTVRERAELQEADRATVVCPFKGLASFEVDDGRFFFGRERLVAEMVARLVGSPLLGVVGPSGSGKSSAVRAGLLCELGNGVLPGSDGWAQVLLRPGEHPARTLEDALADGGGDERLLIAVDQFEEAFTLCRDEAERAAFVRALVAATRTATVVLAVRADFYGRCAAYPKLSRMLGGNHVLVGPMQRDELRRAIELPARRAGLSVEPELVDRLLTDIEAEPGGLPLLSTALLELWQQRDGRHLRLAAYERTGGVSGAVARLAETAYERLDPRQQTIARRVMLRLAGDDVGGAAVRRRVPLDELDVGGDDNGRRVLDVLAASRLLTLSEGTAEVAHEALLREWPRLRAWLDEDAEGRRLHRHLAVAAREWDAGGRDPGELYRGARLASTLDWRNEHAADLNALERTFLEQSRAQSEHDARRARRTNRRLRTLLAGAAVLLVLAAVAGALFLDQRGQARGEARSAEAQRLGAQALVEDDLDRSLLLARQAVALEDSIETRGNLLAALMRSPAAIGVVRSEGNRLFELALRPAGRALVVGDNRGNVLFLDPLTRRRLRAPYRSPRSGRPDLPWQGVAIRDLAFSPDGSRLAIRKAGGVTLLDGTTWRQVATLTVPDSEFQNDVPDATYPHMAFSPDGRTLQVPYTQTGGGFVPATMLRFAARSGAPRGAPVRLAAHDRPADFLTFSPDGGRLVMAENGSIVIRDARTLRPLRRVSGPRGQVEPELAHAFALSWDGRTLAAGGRDGSVRFLETANGEWRTASGRHQAAVQRAAFSRDGRFLVTVGDDANALVWDVAAGSAAETLEGHAGRTLALALDRNAHTLFTASLDGSVIAWDLVGDRRLGRPFDAGTGTGGVPSTALSRDGRTLVTAQDNGAVSMIDTATLSRRAVPVAGSPSEGHGPAFGPGETIVVGGFYGFLGILNAQTGRPVARLRGHSDNEAVFTPTTSADGSIIATTGTDVTLRLWDARNTRPLGPPIRLQSAPQADAGIAPDGRSVAVPLVGGTVDVFDVRSRRRLARLRVDEGIPMFSRFSRDGRLLLTGSREGRVRVFSARDWHPLGPAFDAHAGFVSSVDASPDGRTLVTAGTDGQVRLWDLATRRPIGSALPGPENVNAVAFFAPNGRHLFAIFANGRGYRWDVRPSSWARHACEVAGRRLSRSEWENALRGRAYAPTC